MDIGRVFSISFAMFRQRFWLLLGIWLVFLVIQFAAAIAIFVGVIGMGLAGAAGLAGGLEDPAAFTGLGIGMIAAVVLFYAGYIVILLAQQAAMVTIASPLEEPSFGGAMVRGFRSALPFFALAVLLMLGYFILALGIMMLLGVSDAVGGSGGRAFAAILPILFLPVIIYLACRFAVLIPVVAVDQVFNPITALRRSWSVTRGKILAILLALIAFVVVSLVAVGLPVVLLIAAADAAEGGSGAGAVLAIIGGLLIIPVMIVYTLFAAAFTASLHSEVTGGGSDRLEEVFA
ncbi:glycerophosphoryl diester phosphodiesterase membrane domain-containing protein [Erythrobacter sp. W302b]|uniref:glycerophosphoryl diester phosphodiesterase membrane domain-containing protein n=1 Tax=Erythrobacter sp. W302b TaxID=3389874 RepID=UPI00396B3705